MGNGLQLDYQVRKVSNRAHNWGTVMKLLEKHEMYRHGCSPAPLIDAVSQFLLQSSECAKKLERTNRISKQEFSINLYFPSEQDCLHLFRFEKKDMA